jgi:hypothetical protein
MLVHAKNPRGVLHLERFRIHGKETGRDPCDIPFELYNSCKDGLQDATYREGYLRSKFGRPCPEVAFTYNEIRFLPEKTLMKLVEATGIKVDDEWTHKGLIDAIKGALRNVSPTA